MRKNQNTYVPGEWNALCDSCGFKFKSSELRMRWDGFMVDAACWEPRHPQDFLKSRKDSSQSIPWTRPEDQGLATNSPLYVEDGYTIRDESFLGINQFYERP